MFLFQADRAVRAANVCFGFAPATSTPVLLKWMFHKLASVEQSTFLRYLWVQETFVYRCRRNSNVCFCFRPTGQSGLPNVYFCFVPATSTPVLLKWMFPKIARVEQSTFLRYLWIWSLTCFNFFFLLLSKFGVFTGGKKSS